ncbi:hypothetical protein ES703_44436 [subsurface metagenome]
MSETSKDPTEKVKAAHVASPSLYGIQKDISHIIRGPVARAHGRS